MCVLVTFVESVANKKNKKCLKNDGRETQLSFGQMQSTHHIFKNKGDIQSCEHYTRINIMSHTLKLRERVID